MTDMSKATDRMRATEPDLLSLARALVRNLWVIVTVGIACALGICMISIYTYEPEYTTSATLLVSAKSATGTAVSDISAANSAAEEMEVIFGSEIMQNVVGEELGLSSFDAQVSTELLESTNLLTVSVTAGAQDLSFKILSAMLEHYDLVTDYASTDIVLSELETPTVPIDASNGYSMIRRMAAAFAVGALVMVLLILLFAYMRESVRNEKEFEIEVDAARLVSIRHEKKRRNKGHARNALLLNNGAVSYPFYEAYQTLAVRLMHRAARYKKEHPEKRDGFVILVTSTLENEGKSTVALNLALALAGKNEHVLLADCDLRNPSLSKMLGMEKDVVCGLSEYLQEDPKAKKLILYDAKTNLYMILNRHSTGKSTGLMEYPRMQELLTGMAEHMDYIVVDSPPCAILADAEVLSRYADMKLLVVRQDQAYAKDINDVIDALERDGRPVTGCVFNDVRSGPLSSAVASGSGYGSYRYGRYGYGRYGYGRYGYGRYDRAYEKRRDSSSVMEEHGEEMAAVRTDESV